MSVWNDAKLSEWGIGGGVTPFDPAMINAASIDLRLSNRVCTLTENYGVPIIRYGDKTKMAKLWREPEEFNNFILYPGQAVLLSSMECVTVPIDACGILASKSTAGRCMIEHVHSGFFDSGFTGHATFEVVNLSPVAWRLYPGDRLVQLVMFDMNAPARQPYGINGRYQNQSIDPAPPKGWDI